MKLIRALIVPCCLMLIVTFLIAHGPLAAFAPAAEPGRVTGLSLDKARICVTGYDHNRPDPFPGLGDFIGWTSGVARLANGELLFVHSAGYWHVSFATPRIWSCWQTIRSS